MRSFFIKFAFLLAIFFISYFFIQTRDGDENGLDRSERKILSGEKYQPLNTKKTKRRENKKSDVNNQYVTQSRAYTDIENKLTNVLDGPPDLILKNEYLVTQYSKTLYQLRRESGVETNTNLLIAPRTLIALSIYFSVSPSDIMLDPKFDIGSDINHLQLIKQFARTMDFERMIESKSLSPDFLEKESLEEHFVRKNPYSDIESEYDALYDISGELVE